MSEALGSPVVVLPGFRTGKPSYTMSGPTSYMIYEVQLSGIGAVEAYVRGDMVEGTYTHRWFLVSNDSPLNDDQVTGWRDQTRCADYALAIAHWAWEPHGVVRKGEWSVALGRHIANREGDTLTARVTCENCARKFVQAWQARHGEVPEGWEAFAE